MDRRKSVNGSGEYVGTATPPLISGSDSGKESMMEFDRPGEEKKKRCEATTEAKSGGESALEKESSEEVKKSSAVESEVTS